MRKFLLLLITTLFFTELKAQFEFPVTLPKASQSASVTQTIGLTKITIDYHSPGVKGREIWGKLVPYDKVWRAGANENTVISFSDDVKINDKVLASGCYGIHMIPTAENWTIIFSKNYTSWGSYFYKEEEDALRIIVTPQDAPMQEWLAYNFTDRGRTSATAALHWGELRVPFKIEVNVDELVVENLQKELRSSPYWGWTGLSMAADYCVNHNINLKEAETWIDRSIQLNENFTNLSLKSRLLRLKGDDSGAERLSEEALSIADENELNNYAYLLFTTEKQPQKALEILKMSAKRHNTWSAYYSLAQGYQNAGDKKEAEKNYKKARDKASKDRYPVIDTALKSL